MFFVLKFLFKEKLWLAISFITVLITALLIVVQSLAIAKVATVTTGLGETRPALLPVQADPTTLASLKNIYLIIKNEGNRQGVSYLLAQKDYSLMILLAVIFIGVLFLYQLFAYLKDFSSDFLSLLVTSRIRKLVFNHLLDIPASYYKQNQSGDIISRILNDINGIQIAVFQLFESLLFGPHHYRGGINHLDVYQCRVHFHLAGNGNSDCPNHSLRFNLFKKIRNPGTNHFIRYHQSHSANDFRFRYC